jgi:hypothetical protein
MRTNSTEALEYECREIRREVARLAEGLEAARSRLARIEARLELMGRDPDPTEEILCVLNWIARHAVPRFSRRDLYIGLKNPRRFRQVYDLDAPLERLVEEGVLRKLPTAPTGRKGRPFGPVYEVVEREGGAR